MKQNISPTVVAVIVVVLLVVVGLVGWKMLGPNSQKADDSKAPPGATTPPSQKPIGEAMKGHTPPPGAGGRPAPTGP